MRHRLISLVMALVVVATPLAIDVCRIECEQQARPAVESACHHAEADVTSAPSGTRSVSALPHACEHDGNLPACAQAASSMPAPGTLSRIVSAPPVDTVAQPRRAMTSDLRLIPPLLQAPLRV